MTQEEALSILKTGANVFLTGEPGSGKTHTVNAYVNYLRSCGIEPAITASTGIAATHVGGMTIHSWSGIGVKSRITDADLEMLEQKERLVKRMRNTQVLIIDEISMLSSETLASVEKVVRKLRYSEEPFGGIQVILVGDFFQLPPIDRKPLEREMTEDMFGEEVPQTQFAFRSSAWEKINPLVCYLSEQHRQEDEEFLRVLGAIRAGDITEYIHECLNGRCVPVPEKGTFTKLFPHNANVDRLNDQELGKIGGEGKIFEMTSKGFAPLVEGLKRNCLSPEKLSLKVGAKVMFTKNNPEGKYVNGTLGEVVGFSKTNGQPLVKIKGGKTIEVEPAEWVIEEGQKIIAQIVQLPLRLAWAITVHKSQGMSLDAAVVDLSQAFEYGQGYVALSRVRSLSGLYLLGFNARALEVHPEVLEEDAKFRKLSEEAITAFEALDEEELGKMHVNFVRASGGTPGAGRKKKEVKVSTYDSTRELVLKKLSLKEIAKERGMTLGTIISHLENLVLNQKLTSKDIEYLKPEKVRFGVMKDAFLTIEDDEGKMSLSAARNIVGDDFSFDELKLARVFLGAK